MKNLRKILYILPFILLLVACSKKNITNKTTTKATDKTATKTNTTTKQTTTENKYNVNVLLDKEDAAIVSGTGNFSVNSNTTITITVNDGFTYLGLYDGTNLLTDSLTYEITNITSDIALTAKFKAESYFLNASVDDDTLGSVEAVNGEYECGSLITLKAIPNEGYVLEGWYIGDRLVSDKEEIKFKMLSFDVNIVAKFTIRKVTLTINDNINGNGEYYVNSELYTAPLTYDYGQYLEINFYNIEGYYFDYAKINDESIYYFEDNLVDDITINAIYQIEKYTFSLEYDVDKLKSNPINLLTQNVEDIEYDKTEGYFGGKYVYNGEISFTIRVKEDYSLNNVIESNNLCECTITKDKVDSIYTITFTLIDNYYFRLELIGRNCEIIGLCDETQGKIELYSEKTEETSINQMICEFGTEIKITAVPNKGYKFVKWTSETGGDLQVHMLDQHPEIMYHYVNGDVKIAAVFARADFLVTYYMKSLDKPNATYVSSWYSTYLDDIKLDALNVDGYTFAGWLENADSEEVYSTENYIEYVMTNENINIYTYYTQNSYTVTFDFNGGTGGDASKTLVMGDPFSVVIPNKDNFYFMGYTYFHKEETHYYDNDSTQLVYFIARIFNTSPADAGNIIEKGVVLVNDLVVTDGSTMIYRNDKVTITDYNTGVDVVKPDGTSNGNYYYPFDATFIANWGVLVTKRYNNGEEDEFTPKNIGEKVYRYETPTRTGYKFLGWYVGDTVYDFNLPLEHNIIIEAKWEIIDYNVILDAYNSSYGVITTSHTTAHYGDIVTINYTAYDIYTFEYWYNRDTGEKIYTETITFTMPANDVKYRVYAYGYMLVLKANDKTRGSFTNSTIVARPGASVEIEAIPADGYGFSCWKLNDEIISTDALTTVTMPNSKLTTIDAIFDKVVTDKYERLGNKVWFGYYPQTCLNPNLQDGNNASLIAELKELAGDLPTLDSPDNYEATKDSTQWINYNYYIYPGSKWVKTETIINYNTGTTTTKVTYLKAPHMWYIDIDYDEDGRFDYRGVLIYNYRSDEIKEGTANSSSDKTHQDDNFYNRSTVYSTYWFKYELIEWDILENNDGTAKLIANLAIDSQNFSLSSNSYDSSYIRNFLNDDFYNTAFSSLEKSIMSTMSVDSNNDYVTLLTNEEVESYYPEVADRFLKATEYAQSQNCYVNTSAYSTTTLYNCNWLTRSAYTESGKVYIVNTSGSIVDGKTNMTYYGIRPVITITF